MRSGNHKSFQLSEATPVKRERHEFQFDSAHTSSGKGDAAFQLYCQQNLSPINNFGFGKAAFLHSPALQQTKNFGKSKSVFSPGFHHVHNSKYNQIPHHHQQQYPSAQQNRAASVDQYPILSKDEFDVDYQQHLLKGAGTPLGGNKFHATPVPGRLFPYQNQIIPSSKTLLPPAGTKDREKNGAPQDYIFQSPVFKISFNGKEQLDLFLESGAMDKDQIEHISFVGSSNKVVVSKQSQLEYENSQNSYQRVIQFNDENEEDQQEEQDQQDDDGDGEEDNNQEVNNERQSSRDYKPISTKGVIQRNLLGNVSEESGRMKSLNLFEEAPSQLGAYDSQMTFNPYGNYHDSSTTTVKKPIIEQSSQQISSQHDLRLTATKSNGNQKRKLFASPSFKDDRDLHTPSTKKKKAPSSALNIAGALSNTCQTSSFMNQDEKSQDKVIPEKSKQDDEENQENKQIPTPFTLQASSSAVKPCEEKKICCNCKRTKCLKLYCECFAASRVCEGCSCQGCFNKPEFEHMRKEARNSILERNSSAFDPKIEPGKTQTQEAEEGNLESDQKAHSKGCNCKKSNCLKKYCECFQLGVKCSKLCKCESCKNTTSATYSDDGEYQMSASAIKSSARKQHGHGSMNEYSQFNQFNYFHPDPYYPYYYPTYPYGAYPFFGDYYMCHPEDAEKHQGNHMDTYPYDQLQQKGLSKSNKKHMMQQQQLMIMNGKKGLVKGKIQAEDGFYTHFPAPPLDKKRKIMYAKEDNDEMSSQREEEIEEENNIDNKCSEEEQIEEKEEKNIKQKGKESNNNSQEEIQEENEIKSKTSIKEEVHIDNEAEKSLIKTKQTKNLENQSKLIEEQEQNNTLNTDQMKEELCCQEKENEENGQIKGKKQTEEKQGSNSKSKKNIDLPKRELSKRGSGQKEVTHSILTRRNQESNRKKKKTQQQVDQSDESEQEDGQEEQPQAEMNQGSAKKEENRIITRHLEEKTKQAVSSNSRTRRNK